MTRNKSEIVGQRMSAAEALGRLHARAADKSQVKSSDGPRDDDMQAHAAMELQEIVLSVLKLPAEEFSATTPLLEYGMDSIAATEIGTLFTAKFGIVVPPTVFFEFPDVQSFSRYLVENHAADLRRRYGNTVAFTARPAKPDKSAKPVAHEIAEIAKTGGHTISREVIKSDGSALLSIEQLWTLGRDGARQQRVAPLQPGSPEPPVKQPSRAELQAMMASVDQARVLKFQRDGKTDLECAVLGDGPPLLMLGGLLMVYSAMWRPQLEALSKHFKLIMFHMPGCGGLEIRDGLTLANIVDDVRDVLDAVGVAEPLPVIGCSFGGVIAQSFCLAHPDRCSRLVVCVSTPMAEGATDFQALMTELQTSSSFMEVNRGWPMAALPAYSKVIEGFDLRGRLAEIQVPTLVMAGGKDRYTPPEHSVMIADHIKNATLIEVSDAGHLLPFTHFELFNDAVLTFLTAPGEERFHVNAKSPRALALDSIERYVTEGEQGHCVILPQSSSEVAVLLNACCNRGKAQPEDYRSYIVTSLEEAFDAAIRLARHQSRNNNSASDGTVVVFDQTGDWKSYVDPVNAGPDQALIPGIHVLRTAADAIALLTSKAGSCAAAVMVAHPQSQPSEFDQFLRDTEAFKIARVLVDWNDDGAPNRGRFVERLRESPDVVVFGEALAAHQAPFGCCTIKTSISNPWLMTPNEGYVRQPMAAMGVPIRLVREHLFATMELDPSVAAQVNSISVSADASYEAHLKHGNIGYARVARMHGYDSTFFNAHGMRTDVRFPHGETREIVDCLLNVGCAPRGLNALDIVDGVVRVHDHDRDYWRDLETWLHGKTGFDVTLPTSSQTGALEAAITLGLLSTGANKKLLCFTGGAGFSLMSAASAHDPLFDLWRKPFAPLFPNAVFVDPAAADAEAVLRRELMSGDVGVVLLETIQVEGSAVRTLPANLIAAVTEMRTRGGYLVAVDETQTNLWCGRLLHSETLKPDIVAMATALCDSLMPVGAVLTTSAIRERARARNPDRVDSLSHRHRCQISAHLAHHSLTRIFDDGLIDKIPETAGYFRQRLADVAREFPLLSEVRGDGLLIAIEFDLSGASAFIQRGFGYYLWGAMLRDPEGGVAAVVCPIHNNALRLVPSLSVTHDEIDLVIANLRRRLRSGVDGVMRDCAAYLSSIGDERTANFLSKQIGIDSERSVKMKKDSIRADDKGLVRTLTSKKGMPTICVIGAGVGGISMAGQLQKSGIPFDCFDKRERIGGIWAYDEKLNHTSVWSTLNMNTPLGHYQFSDFPMPKDYPDFPQWQQTQAYLESYIDHLDMRSSFHLGRAVTSARRMDDGRWRIELDSGEVRTYDALVVANGHHNTPNYPAYADKIKFDGDAIHSQHYRKRQDYRGKQVMVVGIGNSGAQIAVDVSFDADKTFISTRRGVYLLPHYLFGVRVDKLLTVTLTWWFKKALPGVLYPLYFTGIYHLVGNHRKIGMPKPDHLMMTCLPTVTESLANRVGDGRIKLVPEVKTIDGNTVHFVDGTTHKVDSIIYATGYHTTLPFFEKDFFEVKENVVPLYKRVFLPGVPNLAFVGMFQAIRWGFLDVMESQAKLIAAYFAGMYQLPSLGEQKADIAKERTRIGREFMHTLRNNYYLHGDTYVRELGKEVKRGLKRLKMSASGLPVAFGGDVVSTADVRRDKVPDAAE